VLPVPFVIAAAISNFNMLLLKTLAALAAAATRRGHELNRRQHPT